jgi:hypothetical protein
MHFKVHQDVLNSVLGYLAKRPFQEVAGLIQSLQSDAELIGDVIHEEKTIGGDDQEG